MIETCSKFHPHFFGQYAFKNITSTNCKHIKALKILLYKKMLLKLIYDVNSNNILKAAFELILFFQKLQSHILSAVKPANNDHPRDRCLFRGGRY